jgi:hypothetical protein
MPLKLNVGLSRKLGLPNYGSVGASCAVEMELEPQVIHDIDTLLGRVHEAFDACRRAIDDELVRQQPSEPLPTSLEGGEAHTAASAPAQVPCPIRSASPIVPLASERQVEFAYHLAREIRSLGGQRLPVLVDQLYGRSLEELTSPEASKLIDLLKQLRAGTRSVDELLAETAA